PSSASRRAASATSRTASRSSGESEGPIAHDPVPWSRGVTGVAEVEQLEVAAAGRHEEPAERVDAAGRVGAEVVRPLLDDRLGGGPVDLRRRPVVEVV